MNKSFRRFLAISTLGASFFASASPHVKAEDTARYLAAQTTRLNDWLSPSTSAKNWRIHLQLNELETLVGRGYRADVSRLAEIQSRFNQNASSQHPNFRAVADAIAAHRAQIQSANQAYPATQYLASDLEAWSKAFESAIDDLHRMSSAELNAARLRTLSEIRSLDQFLSERGPLSEDQLLKPLGILAPTEEEKSEDSDAEDANADEPLLAPSNAAFDLAPTIKLLSEVIQLDWEDKADESEGSDDEESDGEPAEDANADESESGDEEEPEVKKMTITEIRLGLRDEIARLGKYAKQDPNPYVSLAHMLLVDYELKLNLGTRENLDELLKPQVERLVESLEDWTAEGDRVKKVEILRILGLLEATNQSPALVAAFKRTYWHNNALFTVSESLVNRFAARPVQETTPVDEKILDNQVYGTAHTNGQVQIDFVPNDYQAHFSLHLRGSLQSDNYSPVGPITVFAASQAQIEARRSIYLNSGGWFEKAPYGAANLHSFFKGTSCGKLIEQIAAKQFENQRDGAERIAARRAETRMLNQFNNQSTDALNNGRSQLKEQRSQATAIKPYRPTLYVLTSEHFLHGFASRYGASQMSAMFHPPAMTVPSDVAAQVHDSLLNNYLEDELSGLTFTDEDLDRISRKAESESSAVLRSISDQKDAEPDDDDSGDEKAEDKKEREPFEVTLDSTRPVDIHFADQSIYAVVNIRRFRSQGQSISNVQVKTRFKMHYDQENGVSGIRIEQVGEIDAALQDPDDIELDTATMLNLIETTINDELERQRTDASQRGVFLPLNLIDRSKIPALSGIDGAEVLDQARLVVASFQEGWASFAWRLDTSPAVTYSFGDLPMSSTGFETQLPAIATPAEFEALQNPPKADKEGEAEEDDADVDEVDVDES